MEVSREMADLFFEQCCGETSGHMAMIPNSPVLKSICMVHGIHSSHRVESSIKFAEFLRGVADKLARP